MILTNMDPSLISAIAGVLVFLPRSIALPNYGEILSLAGVRAVRWLKISWTDDSYYNVAMEGRIVRLKPLVNSASQQYLNK